MVDMMQQKDVFAYANVEQSQILELPYDKNELTMVLILPNPGLEWSAWEKKLSADAVEKWLGQLRPHRVQVAIPKFKVLSEIRLKEALTKMGMPSAFSSTGADFSGMNGKKNLYIGAVIHKAYIDVHEKGTEAAAATAVTMRFKSAPPGLSEADFRADRPFFFAIRHRDTGSLLFVGCVKNPKE